MYQTLPSVAIPHVSRKDTAPARPFLKWVGGKRSLLPKLKSYMPDSFRNYYEPFVGGGALFFELSAIGVLSGRHVFLSDMNFDLINTYQVIQRDVEQLIRLLQKHARNHSTDYYYDIRAQHDLDECIPIAARMIYLNKTCFNGLWRVNRQGEFNVPIGAYKNPGICQQENLRACHEALANVDVRKGDFRNIKPGRDDFVYFDPPYHPVGQTSFTSYYKNEFDRKDQIALRDFCLELDKRGAKVMVSNSDSEFIHDIYSGFKIQTVKAPRMVNRRGDRRGVVNEVLITTY